MNELRRNPCLSAFLVNVFRGVCAAAISAATLSASIRSGMAKEAAVEPLRVPAIISSSPDGAAISIDGEPRGTTPLQVRLAPGRHVARLEASGSAPTFVEFETDDSPSEKFFTLPRPVVAVLVESEPSGASVTLDGASVGTTPLLLPSVEPGRREFGFSYPGCKPQRIESSLAAPGPVKIEATLESSTATLYVDSEPRGARVSVNGSSRGETPLEVPGVAEVGAVVEISALGFEPWVAETGPLPSGTLYKIEAVLSPLPSVSRVVSIPSGARIYVDDAFVGTTPLCVTNSAAGHHRFRADLEGYAPLARTVTLQPGDNPTQEFRLRATGGHLFLSTAPAGVDVSIDGRAYGRTAGPDGLATETVSETFVVSNLIAGAHTALLTRAGWDSRAIDFTIAEGRSTTLETVELTRKFIPDYQVETKTTGVVRGRFVETTDESVRVETAPGVVRSIPKTQIVRVATIHHDLAPTESK